MPETLNEQPTARLAGFTLVELSIVLVILGLLVGGVLAGQSLIRAAELRTTSADISRYRTAVNAFREKYMGLPGDITNAVRFWGAAAGGTADGVDNTCADLNDTSTTGTCNGDGSGFIADENTPGDNRDQWYEGYRAWQQLAHAGIIEGVYTGNSGIARMDNHAIPGVNAPRSRIGKDAVWQFRGYVAAYGPATDWFYIPAGNFFTLGANNAVYGEGTGPVLTPEEAWNIDTKLDDGKPGKGRIYSFTGTGAINPGCTVDADPSTDYNLSSSNTACSLIIY